LVQGEVRRKFSPDTYLIIFLHLIFTEHFLIFRDVFITITGRLEGIKQAQYIMSNIVKSNMHRLNLTAATAKKEPEKKEEEKKEAHIKIGC
jgi:hypothetical protein